MINEISERLTTQGSTSQTITSLAGDITFYHTSFLSSSSAGLIQTWHLMLITCQTKELPKSVDHPYNTLTQQERRIVYYLASGKKNEQIAEELHYRFDGIVYGVFVSLGFAGVENVLYVLNAGFGTAVVRAIFSIPGHAMFGVVMGFYLSRAKWAEKYGQRHRMRAALRRSFFVPAVLHGLYDFLLMGFEAVFYFYFAGLVIGVIRLLRKSAREDGPI